MQIMNIKKGSIYPERRINTSMPDEISKIYPYLLKEMDIFVCYYTQEVLSTILRELSP